MQTKTFTKKQMHLMQLTLQSYLHFKHNVICKELGLYLTMTATVNNSTKGLQKKLAINCVLKFEQLNLEE